ncbi:MAG: hypothetical protein WKF75_15275 [Singulisphaera sp.]
MMAKHPEQRYDYDELIEALDAGPHLPPQPLFALVDEEPDAAVAADIPLLDGAGLPALTDGFLAGLATSDSDDGRPPPAGLPTVPAPPEADQAPIPLFELPEDDEPPTSPEPATGPRSSIPARTWVVTCALLGLTLVLFVIGVDQLIREHRASRRSSPPRRRARASPSGRSRSTRHRAGRSPRRRPPVTPQATTRMAWTEPSDPVLPSVPETSTAPRSRHGSSPTGSAKRSRPPRRPLRHGPPRPGPTTPTRCRPCGERST